VIDLLNVIPSFNYHWRRRMVGGGEGLPEQRLLDA
jgi:hypothetical protein